MRKFIIGFIVGAIVTATGTAYADDIVESIVGKTIEGQFPVKIEGKQLNTQAAVVDGTSYLPVRAIGEALNMDVKFDADLGIELSEKEVAMPDQTNSIDQQNTNVPNLTKEQLTAKIEYYYELIKIANRNISDLELNISEKPEDTEKFQSSIDSLKVKISDYEKQIADLEAQQ